MCLIIRGCWGGLFICFCFRCRFFVSVGSFCFSIVVSMVWCLFFWCSRFSFEFFEFFLGDVGFLALGFLGILGVIGSS